MISENKNLCIVQARMESSRLPGKVLMKVNNLTLLEHEIRRLKLAKRINKIVIATTAKRADNKIEDLCKKIKIDCFRGSENDVLDRYYQCAQQYPEYDNIIRVTGDCPLIDPIIIDEVIKLYKSGNYDYASNAEKEIFPDGMDIEIFSKQALSNAWKNAKLASEREHATLYIRNNKNFTKSNLAAPKDYSKFRLTVDEDKDFTVIKFLIKNTKVDAGYLDYINLLLKNPEIMKINMNITRNEGLIKSLKNDSIIK